MLRFLIDECLTPDLVAEALGRAFYAAHVRDLGLGGASDPSLVRRAVKDDLCFVTNNRRDFLGLFGREALHPGLIVILPSVAAHLQVELFNLAVDAIEAAENDTVNQLVEVDRYGQVTISAWPFEGSNVPR